MSEIKYFNFVIQLPLNDAIASYKILYDRVNKTVALFIINRNDDYTLNSNDDIYLKIEYNRKTKCSGGYLSDITWEDVSKQLVNVNYKWANLFILNDVEPKWYKELTKIALKKAYEGI